MESQLIKINSFHLDYIEPLTRWRVLSLKKIRELSEYPLHKSGLEKIVRRFEKIGILASFRDPWNKQKYVYLTEQGKRIFPDNSGVQTIDENTAVHDAKVSEIVDQILKRNEAIKAKLENEIAQNSSGNIPDAELVKFEDVGQQKFAFELELTRKSKKRITEKVRGYNQSSLYDYVVYFFVSESVLKSYFETIIKATSEKEFEKYILIVNKSLLSKEFRVQDSKIIHLGKEVEYERVF